MEDSPLGNPGCLTKWVWIVAYSDHRVNSCSYATHYTPLRKRLEKGYLLGLTFTPRKNLYSLKDYQ